MTVHSDEDEPEGFQDEFGDDLEDDEDFDEEYDEDEDEEDAVPAYRDPRTVCHFCGGVGEIAHPVLGLIAGVPRTINSGRVCPLCEGASALIGLTPPV
ncbi:hypothetical protein BC739_008950 [Kutzneria viridogrisea]|uniref:Uncharacterized protein n=1 Tax=Kutzneria viridogrisea TaxID=47990 RepID=A0ABR6BXT6_9PSEU|nr:hypothetical protein [Kutzneria albida]MBA8931698.1 hypothetical protein [Kutzneria viridogrisea]